MKDWIYNYHHAGFDIVANRILEILEEYINSDDCAEMDGDMIFWVTGHSMGGGVANIVAAELLHGSREINNRTDNVFCYTFAAPNTFYSTDNISSRDSNAIPGKKITEEYRQPKTTKYQCIFNIVNDDDFVPKVPMEECNWTKYGRIAKISVNDIKAKIPSNFSSIYDPYEEYKYYIKNKYKANPFITDAAIAGLGVIYVGSKAMRRDTYDFGINMFNVTIKPLYDIADDPYTKPFQKRILNIQQQIPAYLMTSIAYAMHEYNNNGIIKERFGINENKLNFAKKHFANELLISKLSVLIGSQVGEMEKPHYLESYYALCKIISPTNFK